MKRIGIYICNYNKQDDVIKCVESVKKQSCIDWLDICVVDNHSTDDSVKLLREKYKDTITIMENKENVGGSGGFNRGIRDALNKEYDYFMLVDNDVVMEEAAVEKLYEYLEKNPDVGIAGAKILQMANPEVVQDLGGSIDFNNYNMHGNYYGHLDKGLPEIMECDYLSTCCAMARTKAVRQFGLMPEENFIYWDDTQWSKECQLSGYKTVAVNASKVWHRHSIMTGISPFVKYYHTRNRLYYFVKYLDESQMEVFQNKILEEIFATGYGCIHKGKRNVSETLVYALEDFLDGKKGKAESGRIVMQSEKENYHPLLEALREKKNILVCFDDNLAMSDMKYKIMAAFLFKIQQWNLDTAIDIYTADRELFETSFIKEIGDSKLPAGISFLIVEKKKSKYDLEICLCNHVNQVKKNILPIVYVDCYCNCIASMEQFHFFTNYQKERKIFCEKYREKLKNRIEKIRRNGQ